VILCLQEIDDTLEAGPPCEFRRNLIHPGLANSFDLDYSVGSEGVSTAHFHFASLPDAHAARHLASLDAGVVCTSSIGVLRAWARWNREPRRSMLVSMAIPRDSADTSRSSRALVFACVAALLSLTAAAHINGLSNEFLAWDDHPLVTQNPHIQSLDIAMLGWAFTSVDLHNWHPLTWISHAIDIALYGDAARGHHFGNLLLHCMNTLWVFVLACVLLPKFSRESKGSTSRSTNGSTRGTVIAAFFAAALFGVHPQHVESVAWIAERKDVLYVFFLLPCLICYLQYATAEPGPGRRGWYLSALIAFGLSILSKPMAVTVPVILLLLDVFPLKRTALVVPAGRTAPNLRRHIALVIEKLPFIALSALSVSMTLLAQFQTTASLDTRGIGLRIFNAVDAIAAYVRHWALPFDLSPHYPYRFSLAGSERSPFEYSFVICFVLAVTAAGLLLWHRRHHLWLAGWAYYLVTLLPVMGLVSVGDHSYADRYSYVAVLPLHLGFGVLASRMVMCASWPIAARVAVGIGLVGLLLGSIQLSRAQTEIWRNDVTLWERSVAIAPEDFTTQARLAHSLAVAGERTQALKHFGLAFEIKKGGRKNPFTSGMRLEYAQLLINRGELERASEVLSEIKGGVSPRYVAQLHESLARNYCAEKQLEPARFHLEEVTRLDPRNLGLSALRRQVEKACK
jgi:hypothetical protein